MDPVCDLDSVVKPAEIVVREDLESLRRMFSEEERIELWNRVRSAYKRYIMECSIEVSEEIDKLIRGKFRLAQLLLATTFKLNQEKHGEITGLFKDEEYGILMDFEEFKIFDRLSVDDIVEFIRRREGKVYELVMKYYRQQYNVLEKKWGPLMGDLLYGFNVKYRARRRKIEEAVVEYIRRYGLLETVSEIEEAVKKVVEAGDLRRRIEEEVMEKLLREMGVERLRERLRVLEEERDRLYKLLERVEEKAVGYEEARDRSRRLEEEYSRLVSKLTRLEKELMNAYKLLSEKEQELARLKMAYEKNAGAREALEAEIEALRKTMEELEREAKNYKKVAETLEEEKRILLERLEEVKDSLEGRSEGHLVSIDEARAIGESFFARIRYRIGDGVELYDPRSGRRVRVKEWSNIYRVYYGDPEKDPIVSQALVFTREKGVLFKKKDILVYAIQLVHSNRFSENGFDNKPVSLAELVDTIKPIHEEAVEQGYYALLVVSSPTGFTGKTIEFVIGGAGKGFVSKNLTLYLLDPVTNTIYYNHGDPAAVENYEVVKIILPREEINRVVEYMLSREALLEAMKYSPAEPMLHAKWIAGKLGIGLDIVRNAFQELEEKGYGKVVAAGKEVGFKYSGEAIEEIMASGVEG